MSGLDPQNREPAVTAPAQDGLGLDDQRALAPLRPPVRQQDPKQPIDAALRHRNLMAQHHRFQNQRSAGSGFASGDWDRAALSASP